MKDIIITGGTGFIGKNLTDYCRKNFPGSKVFAPSSSELNLTDYVAVNNYFEKISWSNEVTHIFHLAALYKAGGWPVHHPATQLFVNTAMNNNFFENAKKYFSKARITSVVSYCVYPDHDSPHPETEVYGSEPEDYLYAYAFTKKGIIIANRAYAQEFGMSLTSVVLPTVYGPGDSISEDSHVMGALIGKFLKAKENNLPTVEIWGNGEQEREFIYVEDVVSGILAASAGAESQLLNLGVNRCYAIKDIANIINKVTGYTGQIVYNTNRFTGALKRVMDSDKMQQELNWQPSVSIEEGIEKTINFYKK